jgi:hypothetical protein
MRDQITIYIQVSSTYQRNTLKVKSIDDYRQRMLISPLETGFSLVQVNKDMTLQVCHHDRPAILL